MSDEKRPKVPDYEGDLWRQEYAPGVAELLQKLSDLDEKTVVECVRLHRSDRDFARRLSVLLSENLKSVVAEVYQLPDLSALSLRAMRERATHPKTEAR